MKLHSLEFWMNAEFPVALISFWNSNNQTEMSTDSFLVNILVEVNTETNSSNSETLKPISNIALSIVVTP